jgi:hypothetical protein
LPFIRQVLIKSSSTLQSEEDAAERQADRDLEKVVKGIKHNTIRAVSLRGTQAKGKQFKAVAEAMKVNTTVVSMDFSNIKYTPSRWRCWGGAWLTSGFRIPTTAMSSLCDVFSAHKTLSTLKCKNSQLSLECLTALATYLAASPSLRTLSLAANAISEKVPLHKPIVHAGEKVT